MLVINDLGFMAKTENSLGTVARVIALLRILAERSNRVTLSDLATELSLAPSTIHRLLAMLKSEGLVDRDPVSKMYYCDAEFVRIASLVLNSSQIKDLAMPSLRALIEEFNETTLLCLYLPQQRRYTIVSALHGTELLRYDVQENTPLQMAWGATARSILAFLPEEDIDAILKDATPSATGADVVDDTTRKELATIRKRGFALTKGQRIAGSIGIGAPVYGIGGKVLGSLCLTIPKGRFDPKREATYAEALIKHAAQLSHSLGYVADNTGRGKLPR